MQNICHDKNALKIISNKFTLFHEHNNNLLTPKGLDIRLATKFPQLTTSLKQLAH